MHQSKETTGCAKQDAELLRDHGFIFERCAEQMVDSWRVMIDSQTHLPKWSSGSHSARKSFPAIVLLLIISSSAPCAMSVETCRELIADTCYNARQQLQRRTLWASQIQRRDSGHLYVEQEIETVDGRVRRLISVDSHEPSPTDRKHADAKLRDLLQNPKARVALKRDSEADAKKLNDLLQVIPEMFIFEDQGDRKGFEELAFRPNPEYKPKTYLERAMLAMSGFVLVDRQEKRLARLSARVMKQVDFGYGVIGRLNEGGTIEISRVQVAPGIWKTQASKIDITARLVMFKTVNKQEDEVRSNFKPVAPGMDIVGAIHLLMPELK